MVKKIREKESGTIRQLFFGVLLIDKLPYLLSILFVGAGLIVSYLVKEVERWPILEYDVKFIEEIEIEKKKGFLYRIEVENITTTTLFEELVFLVDYNNPNNDRIIVAQPVILPPAHFKNLIDKLISGLQYEIALNKFQPGWKIHLELITTSKTQPVLSCFSPGLMYLKEKSFQTWVYKNKLSIIISLGAIWIILIVLYLFALARTKGKFNLGEK